MEESSSTPPQFYLMALVMNQQLLLGANFKRMCFLLHSYLLVGIVYNSIPTLKYSLCWKKWKRVGALTTWNDVLRACFLAVVERICPGASPCSPFHAHLHSALCSPAVWQPSSRDFSFPAGTLRPIHPDPVPPAAAHGRHILSSASQKVATAGTLHSIIPWYFIQIITGVRISSLFRLEKCPRL